MFVGEWGVDEAAERELNVAEEGRRDGRLRQREAAARLLVVVFGGQRLQVAGLLGAGGLLVQVQVGYFGVQLVGFVQVDAYEERAMAENHVCIRFIF